MFEGHKLYKINKDWVFDLTEFVGYKVFWKNGRISEVRKMFSVEQYGNRFVFYKYGNVPLKVLKNTEKIIDHYYREAYMYA